MVNIILDTNVLIYFIKGTPEGNAVSDSLKARQIRFGISTITEMELYAKPELMEEEKMIIEECFSYFEIIPVTSRIAKIAAYYRKNYNVPYGDTLIVATAKYFNIPLWTYHTKDFSRLTDMHVTQPPAHPY